MAEGSSELQSILGHWGKHLGSFFGSKTKISACFTRPLCAMRSLSVLPFQHGHDATISWTLDKLSILKKIVIPTCYWHSVCVCNKWTLRARWHLSCSEARKRLHDVKGIWLNAESLQHRRKKNHSVIWALFLPIHKLWHLCVMWLKPNNLHLEEDIIVWCNSKGSYYKIFQ